ncbi:MAG: SiaB family protein kinase [Bacteroidota bacterium]|nr:SiaB family protein kinase [Bacteroidota bacterium]
MIYNNLQNYKIALSYCGSFNDDITSKLINISEFYLEHKSEISALKNKVSFLIAECFQNIVRHSDSKQYKSENNHSDFFQLKVLEDRIAMSSCNLIENEYIEELKEKLIKLNALDADNLKKLYSGILKDGNLSEKGGAGLGLIEMARKSGLPLKFKFIDFNTKTSRFLLSLEIIQKNNLSEEKVNIDEVQSYYEVLLTKNVLIQYKGDFSKQIINPILDMIKLNFKKSKGAVVMMEKRVVICLIEAIENISNHGKLHNGVREGVLTISKTETNYILETFNYLETTNYQKLNTTLTNLKKLNSDELNELYKKKIMETDINSDERNDLGLIEIARKSNNNFSFEFNKINVNEYSYSITITI